MGFAFINRDESHVMPTPEYVKAIGEYLVELAAARDINTVDLAKWLNSGMHGYQDNVGEVVVTVNPSTSDHVAQDIRTRIWVMPDP